MREQTNVTRRQLLSRTAAGSIALATLGTVQPNEADAQASGRTALKPNILFILADGMQFMQAYANSAVCTASRVALITGRYQYRLSVGLEEPLSGRETRKVGLPPEHATLPSILKKAGYQSTLIGKWHLGKPPDFGPLQSGYDHFYGFRGGALDYYTHKFGPPA